MPATKNIEINSSLQFAKIVVNGNPNYFFHGVIDYLGCSLTYDEQYHPYNPVYSYTYFGCKAYIPGVEGASIYHKITLSGNLTGPGAIYILSAFPNDYDGLTNGTRIVNLTSAGSFSVEITAPADLQRLWQYGISLVPTVVVPQGDATIATLNALILYSANTTPPEVVGLHPDDENVKGANPITCAWSFSHITGMVQTDWKIYTVRNAGTPVLRASGSGAATSGTIPANALDPGLYEWYVKVTATEDGDTINGQSEPRYMIVRYDSSTSSVTCDGKPQPTVSWESTWQAAFQIEFNGEKFKPIYSAATSYKLPLVYDDGVYPVRLRILDSEGNWTEWTEPIYADIHNTPPTSGTLTLTTHIETGVAALNWTLTDATAAFYTIHRDGVQIYAGNETSYVDLRGCGKCEYTVRAMMSDSNCIAAKKTITVLPPSDLFILESEDGLISRLLVRHHPSRPSRRIDITPDTEFRHFAGRVFPVAVSEGHKTRGISGTAMFKTAAEAERLMALAGKTLIYKDRNGNSIFGVMTGVGRDSALAETMSWRIEATDGDEVDYID